MQQVRPFVIANAGTDKYWCLQNVRRGYGIPAYYSTARKAWDGAIKHPNQNFPAGCAVPVFWSLKLTLDGVYADYGHVAVRLPDGRIWTDGRYYNSVNTLNQYYLGGKGTYLGWSENLNNVTVVKESEMLATRADLDLVYKSVLRRTRGAGEGENVYLNKDLGWVYKDVSNSQEKRLMEQREAEEDALRAKLLEETKTLARKVDELSAQIVVLGQKINEKQAEVDALADKVSDLEAENKELKAQLATCGDGEDTENLNKLGELLRWIITRLGLKG